MLREQAREMGMNNLSDLIRHRCGLPRGIGLTAPLPGVDDVEDLSGLMQLLVRYLDRQDQMHVALTRIARHLNVPFPQEQPPGEARKPHVPAEMPAGFSR